MSKYIRPKKLVMYQLGEKRRLRDEIPGDPNSSPPKDDVVEDLPKSQRYFVFCETPERLQELLDSVQYYDLKDTIVIPPAGDQDKPTVCVVMEDPDEHTRITLERVKRQTRDATSSLLRKTGMLLEDWADKLSTKKK